MDKDTRQIEIYNYIKTNREVNVATLVEYFQVSPVTMRRTLSRLESNGLIARSYGKVKILKPSVNPSELTHAERAATNKAAKQAMAQIAYDLIVKKGYHSIFIEGSTSALEIAKVLPANTGITVFSNSCSVFEVMRQKPLIKFYFIGGFIDWNDQSSNVLAAEEYCKQIYVDATFTSCTGFSERGTFNDGYGGSQIRRTMMKNSSCNFLLADHSKFNTQAIFMLSGWDSIQTLITDQPLPAEFVSKLNSYDVDVYWKKQDR